jgi:hypothetical protein
MLEGNLNRIRTRQLKLSYHVVQRYSRSARLPKREKILNCAIREIWMYRILFWMMYKQKNRKLDKVWTHSRCLSEYHQEGRMWGKMGIGIC